MPSYVCADNNNEHPTSVLYACDEVGTGTVRSYDVCYMDSTVTLKPRGGIVSFSGSPCHISTATDSEHRGVLVMSNYPEGSVTVVQTTEEGPVGQVASVQIDLGPDFEVRNERQEGPHAHQV